MTDQPKKRRGRLPWGALAWTTVGGLALVRAFWNPQRAVVKDGFAGACEGGPNCSPYVTLQSSEGSAPIYSAASGVVVRQTGTKAWIIPNREAVVLEYMADAGAQIMVRQGESVRQGQQIASASQLSFAVFRIDRTAQGPKYVPLSPSAWLAARGLSLSAKKHAVSAEGSNWCEGGRKLRVPEQVGNCGIKLPEPSSVALLPISVTMG